MALYGRAMNTFWGCEPEALTELSAAYGAGAARMRHLIDKIVEALRSTDWQGPDADEHRLRTAGAVEMMTDLIGAFRKLEKLLRQEAAEQTACSRAEAGSERADDPLGVRAAPPWVSGPVDLPRLSGAGPQSWGPMIGGPFAAKDPFAVADRLPRLPDLGDIGPMIGGPFMSTDPQPIPAPRQVAEGPEFGIDPEILAEAQQTRRVTLGAIPAVGTAQMLMGAHAAVGDTFDRTEQNLQESGLGALTPVVSLARVPHSVAGIALGEKSVLGQATSGVDASIANTMQTSDEISAAIGDGDLAGVVSAGERGMFRQAGVTADVLTATPVPALTESTADVFGAGAHVVETVSPEAAAPLREVEQASREAGESWESGRGRLTDAERYYDTRRQYAPMPWDPQG